MTATPRTVSVPDGTTCAACGGAPDFVIGDESRTRALPFCLPCAKRCANETHLPSLDEAIQHFENARALVRGTP